MKRFLLVSLVLLCFLGCKLDNAKEDLRIFLKEHEPEMQIFKINSDSTVELTGKKGTILKIDPSVLQHQDGSVVKGELEIHLLELTSKEDLLRANAQTVSDDKWLISGGAYNIQIFSENKELKIADEKSIDVRFPKIATEEMQLFDGSRTSEGNMNWELLNQVLQNRQYPVIVQEDSSFMRYNRQWAIDMVIDTTVFRMPKERFSVKQIQKKYSEIDSLVVQEDTLFAYIFSMRKLMVEMMSDSLLSPLEADELVRKNKTTRKDIMVWELYNTISISKLGWINVDRFYPKILDRVRLELVSDIEMDYSQMYAADVENNTLLNLNEDEDGGVYFSAPKGKRFAIIAFGIKSEQIFGYKKVIRVEENAKHKIKYKKADRAKMETFFRLD